MAARLGPFVLMVDKKGWRHATLRNRKLAELRARRLFRLGYAVSLVDRVGTVIYSGGPRSG
jgi:hypothetical protein